MNQVVTDDQGGLHHVHLSGHLLPTKLCPQRHKSTVLRDGGPEFYPILAKATPRQSKTRYCGDANVGKDILRAERLYQSEKSGMNLHTL
ncbi:hypothetical protein MGYG_08312 [Nannizzia gypsea CBS 118893]|uniref:Uncharacterized protein n=1 Tax=Arthroderma gypseum (strain ATCC MYA-4604 / CBS 118893) TaxID=535722 RepID=E4V6B8_ARTGP|nr:hypothetical protein MGYG_08312 [Nannizzia gypsea CBS 118893]EFR05301.1 hypothetical protein MGYG_08312 [Nannizzia gypsea CBS 118893]